MKKTNSFFVLIKPPALLLTLSMAAFLAGCKAPPVAQQGNVEAFKRIRFEDTPEGARAILDESILFIRGSSELNKDVGPIIEAIKPSLDKARKQVTIEGHTDTTGSRPLNMKLSQERADKVRAILIAHQVPPSRLVAKGLGSNSLRRNPESSEEDARLNRRAEFLFPGETVESLRGKEVETRVEGELDRIAKELLDGAKKIGTSVEGFFKSLNK